MMMCCEPAGLQKEGAGVRKTVLFHAGLPKTGSTSIQHGLVSLADELRTRGIWVPYDRALYGSQFPNRAAPRGSPQSDGFSYFFNVRDLRPDTTVNWADTVAQFLRDDDAKTLVVSHENISQAARRQRKDLFSALAAQADIRFLIYLRQPHSYLNSYCLQLVHGLGNPVARADMRPVTRYLKGGYAKLLAPFEDFGRVDARNFDDLRKEDRLLPDFFTAIGAGDLGDRVATLNSRNIRAPRLGLACVFMALKSITPPQANTWFAMRAALFKAGVALEPPMETLFLPASLTAKISERWEQDRQILGERYGVQFGDISDFRPGPETLSFSAQYGAALHAAVKTKLSASQNDWLAAALTLADQDLESVLALSSAEKGPSSPLR